MNQSGTNSNGSDPGITQTKPFQFTYGNRTNEETNPNIANKVAESKSSFTSELTYNAENSNKEHPKAEYQKVEHSRTEYPKPEYSKTLDPGASLEALRILSGSENELSTILPKGISDQADGNQEADLPVASVKTEGKNFADNSTAQITIDKQMNLFTDSATPEEDKPFLSKQALEEHRIIGQVFSTYWLVEYNKDLYIIDQHAAHEKVLYERIMTAAKTKTITSQQLLPPIVLSLTLREQEVLLKREETLQSLGYEIEHFGGNEYSVRAVPADLYGI
jgi:DNA mismatch repair ATPase MutL